VELLLLDRDCFAVISWGESCA